MSPVAASSQPQTESFRLLGPDDPPVFTILNETSAAPVLLLCDHARNTVPKALERLGLEDPAFGLHIAYDIGAEGVTRRLSQRFGAPAVLSNFSRLVIDLNRALDDPTAIPEISDGIVVPGNRDLDEVARARRIRELYDPYHAAVAGMIDRMMADGRTPAVMSIHSFTPVMRGFERPWHVGVLWDRDPRIAVPLIEKLRADTRLVVGDNEPYTGRRAQGTVDRHAVARGLPHVLVEVRQDLIADETGQAEWAERLAGPLEEIMADPLLFHIEHF